MMQQSPISDKNTKIIIIINSAVTKIRLRF